jgi:hypothetical protein
LHTRQQIPCQRGASTYDNTVGAQRDGLSKPSRRPAADGKKTVRTSVPDDGKRFLGHADGRVHDGASENPDRAFADACGGGLRLCLLLWSCEDKHASKAKAINLGLQGRERT